MKTLTKSLLIAGGITLALAGKTSLEAKDNCNNKIEIWYPAGGPGSTLENYENISDFVRVYGEHIAFKDRHGKQHYFGGTYHYESCE